MKNRKLVTKVSGPISYFQKGSNPKLLIHSGTHGDEWRVIEPLTKFVFKNAHLLPDFIYVPEVSPSAVAQKTRKNHNNLDVNRNCFDNPTDEEVHYNLKIIEDHFFDICLSFHEDPEYSEFYLYDSGMIEQDFWQEFVSKLAKIGLDPLNGIDDPNDPDLGFEFSNGYFSFNHLEQDGNSGTFSEYCLANGKTTRFLLPEIPSNSTKLQKKQAIELIFFELLATTLIGETLI